MLNRLKGVFGSLRSHDVHYVVIGGIAAVLYGVPRATFDLDILIEPTMENAERLLLAFLEAGLGTAELTTPDDLLQNEITVFNDFVRVDVQTATPGLVFEQAWSRRIAMRYEDQELFVVCKSDLVAAKRAAGRPVDLDDVHLLEQSD